MTFPVNFKFPYQVTNTFADTSVVCSPVQTVSGGTDWSIREDIQTVYTSSFVSAAIKTDGTLWLWGNGNSAQLGNNSTLDVSSPVQTVSTGTNWKQVAIGSAHTGAIKTDGTLWLWGNASNGRLGNNSSVNQSSPVQTISQGTNWKQFSSSATASAAIKTDGTLWMWGKNSNGELGNNTVVDQSSPVQTIAQGNNWKQVSSGSLTGAIKTDGTLWLWGIGTNGSMANGFATGDKSSPIQTISTGNNWKQVSATATQSAGAIKTDGTLWLWGKNNTGSLGNGFSTGDQCSPVQTVSTGTNWKQLSISDLGPAAIKTDGTLWLWGAATNGRLGNNSISNQCSPVQTVSTGTNWKQVSTDSNAIAIKTDGTLWTWGNNASGELGNNSTINQSSPVQTVSNVTTWSSIADEPICSSSLGVFNSAAVKTDGTLWIWGGGACGTLGNNSTITQSSPVQTASTGTNWKQVSLGCLHSAAIKTDGTLWLWGQGTSGKLGNNLVTDHSSPIQTIATGNNWKQVALGTCNSAAIKTDGTLWLWGDGGSGVLGNNLTTAQSSPVQTVATGTNWKQVSVAIGNAPVNPVISAVKTDGTLWIWGANNKRQLGMFNNNNNQSSPVQTISTATNWKQVSVADGHAAAIKTDGTLWLWGDNAAGQLGDNTKNAKSSPIQTIATGTNWKQTSSGQNNSSATKIDGTLWVWGDNTCGQLGNNLASTAGAGGTNQDQSSPVQTICTGISWEELPDHQGYFYTAALTSSNRLYLWGDNLCSQLGKGLTEGICSSVCADFDDVFVRREIFSQGGLWGWGDGSFGALGNNSTINQSSPVQTISGGTNWKQVSLGNYHSAAIKTDGTLWLWGCGGDTAGSKYGWLGDNSSITIKSSPVQTVATGANWKQVGLGFSHSAAIKTDGTLWIWGCGASGALGDNTSASKSSPIQTISTGTNWKQVALGCLTSSAIKTDGTLWLWGNTSFGKLGNNNSTTNQSSPVQTVATGTDWKQVSLGDLHSAAIKTDGTFWIWGYGTQGQLGNNSTIAQSSPVQTVTTGTNWKQVSLGSCHSAAIKTDGTLWLWGYGVCGILGNNSTIDRSSPVQTVSTGTNWKQVSLNCSHSAAIKTDGTLWLWGNNTVGRLGNTTISRSSPIQTVSTDTNWIDISVGGFHSFGIREGCW